MLISTPWVVPTIHCPISCAAFIKFLDPAGLWRQWYPVSSTLCCVLLGPSDPSRFLVLSESDVGIVTAPRCITSARPTSDDWHSHQLLRGAPDKKNCPLTSLN